MKSFNLSAQAMQMQNKQYLWHFKGVLFVLWLKGENGLYLHERAQNHYVLKKFVSIDLSRPFH